ncbi:autotransporter outer membrane beta-barrel domain-containing protein [Pasteurella atlantica]|uniref:autotransporter outer membrane beta-barrel domain-containing protein n=1 Tax=Pasteurella atlantica TaxID=2827233 RepID=UPI0027580327|nr:autotransporter outer membrane beta-barrel domain-containing protein [Pasteurella atlantica]MDP8076195.1 autotransporter outer membrane beta-barrel domain-containing protein [Pasteurella atlantica]MDP8078138.1 autotransporter outer membrane beta-barrel domain-containing protein [Pasteurella atlantica]MDP8120945.1 autotransporter outer membrane beta-barrel domain-containing protein [Pasteurella atlantica]
MIGRFSKSPKNNSVEVIDTKGVSINNVIGSFPISYPFSLPFISNNDTTYNTVTIKGGHIGQHTITSSSGFSGSSVYGGISAFKNSNNNKVIVNDGIIDGDIYGGTSKSGNAENNIIEINGGTVGYDVSGGDGDLTGGYSLEGNANNNTVKITGGKMAEDVYGGYAGAPGYSHTGNANSNSIMITGGQVDQQVVGGKSILGNAINNTLTIKGGQFGKETIFYGGYTGVGKGDVRTGNKLNLHKSGFNIKNIANFEDINFYVQSDTKKDETFLTLSDTNGTDISDTRVGVAVEGSSLLNKGDEVILIKQTGGDITFPSNMDNHIEGMQGTAVEYTFKLHKDDNKTFIACALGQNVSKCDPKITKWLDLSGTVLKNAEKADTFLSKGIDPVGYSYDGMDETSDARIYKYYKPKTTKWIDFDGKEIQTTVTGKDFAEAGKFDGYHISKTKVSDDGLTKTYILGKVINAGLIDPIAYKVKTTKWVDFDGKEIQTTVTGKDFAEAGKFDGYHISKTKVSDDGLTKTYILGKVINAGLIDPNLAYKVKTTKWVDFDGKEIQTMVTGKDFAEAGKFDGYHISKTKVSDDGLTKTYILGKVINAGLIDPNLAYKVKTTKWVDFDGKEIQTTVTGKDFAEAGKFDGYHISKTKVSDDGLTKTYILGKVINAGLIDPNLAYKVKTTKWIDFEGKEVQTTVTGKDFAEAGKFDGYHISKTTISDDGLTKTYILGKVINAGLIDPNLAYKVKTTKWIDFEGKEIQTTVTGKDFAEAGKFDGYHISKTKVSDDGLTKTYILGKVIKAGLIDPNLAYKVKTTKWLDNEGNEIQTAVKGKDFEEQGVFIGYDFNEVSVSDDGLTKTYIFGKLIDTTPLNPDLSYKVKTTKWLDSEGKEIQTAVTGKDFEEQGVFIGYDFNEVKVSDDGLTKTYIFGKLIDTTPLNPDLAYKVKTTKWLDDEGNEIQATVVGKDFEEQGIFVGYDFNEVKVSADGLTKTYIFKKQNVINNVAGRVAKQTESYLNTGIVGIEFVNHGFDLTNSLMDNGLNLNNNLHGFKAFGTIDSSKWTVNYTDLDSFNMVTGVGAIKNNNIFGAFIEAGSGQYHSKTMTKDNIVFSNGNSRYYGIGMLFQTKLNAIYLTSSAKLGKSITSYKSSNIKGAKNNKVNFTSKRNYAGMTLKGAYTAFPNYSINVTPYIEGSYLYFGKDNVMIENQNFTFNKIESLETGVGIKLKGYINNHINIYTDAKWIREYRGIAQGKVLGLDMPSVNVRGDTQSLKVGLDVNFNNNFYMDINMNKSFGIHRGMNTGLLFMYNY